MGNSVLYGLVVIAGFIILGGAMIYAKTRNKISPGQHRETEAATRRLYDDQPRSDELPR